ncbi:zinc finger protein 883-like isoform X2 [Salarias fasciatus]|uniref:zinc finger protein 883-like isoform X2 n=1 Tax=Salarias fasciatus TaxID=181472 RepID=UPI001176F2F9|nr:zinc finger protein 883-like isoform X2 [Salarias fasciatus]
MSSLEALESQMCAAVRTLVGAAVAELGRLLEQRSANAANEDEEKQGAKAALCRSINAHIKQFESFLEEWSRNTVEKISLMFKVFVCEAEDEDAPAARTHLGAPILKPQEETDGVSHEERRSEPGLPFPETPSGVGEVKLLREAPPPSATTATKKKPIKCPSCEKTFPLKCLMERHHLSHSKPHHCSECGKRFSVLRGLRAHMRKHTGEMLHRCPDCGTEFAYKSTFQRHARRCSLQRAGTATCSLCEVRFPGSLALQRHRCGALDKTFVCSLCPSTFECRRSLSEHESLHAGVRDFVCEVCGETFLSAASLATHRVTHMQTEQRREAPKSFACRVCGKGCSHRSALKHHMLTHSGERPYVCETCGKRCGHASALQNHRRVHTGRRPGQRPVCHLCGKQFRRADRLRSHMSVHTGEKPHACHQCGKTFSSPDYLRAHQLVHSEKKPYSCSVCSKSFTHMYSLKMHSRIHTGERAHRCLLCGKDFIYSSFLKRHLKTHRPEEDPDRPAPGAETQCDFDAVEAT